MRDARLDRLGANVVGRALYTPVFDSREQPANSARFTFLDPVAADFYPEWDRVASELVAHLRSEAGRDPYDRRLSDLVGALDLSYESMELSADDLSIAIFTPEPGSPHSRRSTCSAAGRRHPLRQTWCP